MEPSFAVSPQGLAAEPMAAFYSAPPIQQQHRTNRGYGIQPRHHQPHLPRRQRYQAGAAAAPYAPRIEDRGVKRARECPCAARLYLLEQNDIATGNIVCSAILGVPSAFGDAAGEDSEDGTSERAPPLPRSVYMVWADTSLWELSMEALRASRAWADDAFLAARVEAAREQDGNELAATPTAAQKGTSGVADGRTDAAPSSSAAAGKQPSSSEGTTDVEEDLPHYRVELLCGYADGQGQAVVHGLGTVELRQVVTGRPELLFPVRQGRGSVDYNAVVTELGFGYGNPILFTCTRVK